jgi:hypothetical protein
MDSHEKVFHVVPFPQTVAAGQQTVIGKTRPALDARPSTSSRTMASLFYAAPTCQRDEVPLLPLTIRPWSWSPMAVCRLAKNIKISSGNSCAY